MLRVPLVSSVRGLVTRRKSLRRVRSATISFPGFSARERGLYTLAHLPHLQTATCTQMGPLVSPTIISHANTRRALCLLADGARLSLLTSRDL